MEIKNKFPLHWNNKYRALENAVKISDSENVNKRPEIKCPLCEAGHKSKEIKCQN
jgi:hypothetical protein